MPRESRRTTLEFGDAAFVPRSEPGKELRGRFMVAWLEPQRFGGSHVVSVWISG